jgi:hypothetical protein
VHRCARAAGQISSHDVERRKYADATLYILLSVTPLFPQLTPRYQPVRNRHGDRASITILGSDFMSDR